MLVIPSELVGLRPISLRDQSTFVSAVWESNQKSWLYFFPFLYGFSQAATQTLLWETWENSVCLYFLRQREAGYRLDLYLPPFPFSRHALEHALARIASFNGRQSCRITWVEECQKERVAEAGFNLELIEEEYIYDSEFLRSTTGSRFQRLRRNLSKARRLDGLQVRSYRKGDEQACIGLLNSWRRLLRDERNIQVSGQAYMRSCLIDALSFEDDILQGEVVHLNDRLCAFTFGGKLTASYGSLYVAVSDHEISGLGYLQRYNLMMNIKGVRFFNDSSDVGRPGLAEVKKAFNPVGMNRLYRGRLLTKGA
jgi:hypothetical protein